MYAVNWAYKKIGLILENKLLLNWTIFILICLPNLMMQIRNHFVCCAVICGFLVEKTDSACVNHTCGLPDQKAGSLTAVALTVTASG